MRTTRSVPPRLGWAGVSLGLGLGLLPAGALAHSGGVQGGSCSGCHGNGDHDAVIMTAPSSIDPGDDVTVTLSLMGSANVAGIYVESDAGDLSPISGQGLASVGSGLTHTSPRSVSGGQASFTFRWAVPNQPGAARFVLNSVLGNGNGSSGGDGGAEHFLDVVYGCQPQEFFRDFDGDGYGRGSSPRVFCAGSPPQGYALTGDDCDDNRDTVYPGATEFCNLRDDDCNDAVDDDAIPVEQYPDEDGDGFYSPAERETGKTFTGCVPTEGWAADPGDCAGADPLRNPGAEEVCNLFDDNCDGRVDERVRPTCGEGWCRRESNTCELASCVPGQPTEEVCNLLDDDCDGFVDEQAPCEDGQACIAGQCREAEDPPGGSDDSTSGPSVPATESGVASETDTDAVASQSGGGGGCRTEPNRPAWWALVLVGAAAFRRRRG